MPRTARRALLLAAARYHEKLLESQPLALWPCWETEGSVAVDVTGHGHHAAYTGVTLGQAGIGDGQPCPYYDAVNDYLDVYSASLAAAFSGAAGSCLAWMKVNAAAVWSDGVERVVFRLLADANNYVYIRKATVAGQFGFVFRSGGTTKSVTKSSISDVGWIPVVLTWSEDADELIAYWKGAQEGATQTGLGTWAGNLAANECFMGASSIAPANVYHGWLQYGGLWDRALTPAEVADFAVVR